MKKVSNRKLFTTESDTTPNGGGCPTAQNL